MKGEILFEKMTGISEEYITEAALVPAVDASTAPRREGRFAALSRALNGGWGVACICFIVAIATIVGMVAWGRMGTTGPGSDPSVRFAFSYEMTANDGSAWSGTAVPGDVVNVNTTVVNHGKSFTGYDFFAYARFVLQEDESVVIEGHYPVADAAPQMVEIGQRGTRSFHFHIPEDATPGVYDLVLSYDGVQQVFSGALTVGYPTGETKPPIDTPIHAFSFGYEPFGGFATVNAYVTMETWIVNEGAPFTFTGSSMGFAPDAVLVHADTGYRIEGMFDVTTDFTEVTVYTGEEGRCTQEFFIPADAPTGDYDLVLTYETASQTFENVLTVAIPSDGDTPSLDLDAMWEIAEQYIPQVAENVDRIYYTRGSYSYSADYTLFSFRVTILGMQTTESLYVTLGSRGEYRSHEQDPQTFSLFIPYITAEMIEAAKPPHYEHPDYPVKLKHQYGLTLRDGDLYLAYACYDDSEVEGEGMTECYYSTSVFLYADPQRVEAPAGLSKLTMAVGAEWLYEPLEEAYVPGEEVTLRFRFATDMEPLLILNGAFVESRAGDEQSGYWEYSFAMPDTDSDIYFHTYDKTLPYADMLETCIAWDHYTFSEKEFYYYGEFGNGVKVALLLGNDQQITGTSVGLHLFITPTTHEMLAYYNGGLYRLKTAYEVYELLTEEDLADLFALHKSFFPNVYDDLPSPK